MNQVSPTRTPWESLLPVGLAIFLINLDMTVVNLALPAIARDLHTNLATIQWVVNGYLAAGASFLIFQGRLADALGRRPVFIVTSIVFVAGSALTAAAAEPWHLIVGRIIQGIGIGVFPIAMAHIQVAFPARDRNTALGIATAVAGVAAALGPTLGGMILHLVSWRWVFLMNVPLGAVAIMSALAWLGDAADHSRLRLDWYGQAILCLGLFLLLSALNQGQIWGYSSVAFGGVALSGVVLLLVFFVVETRSRDPLLDLGLFRIGSFATANAVRWLFQFVSLGVIFLVSLFIQSVLNRSALIAGLTLLWLSATTGLLSPLVGRSLDRIGPRRVLVAGMGSLSGACLLFSFLSADSPLAYLFPPLFLCGLAVASILSATVSLGLSAVPLSKTTQASGALYTTALLGGAAGIAVTGFILHLESLSFTAFLAREGTVLSPQQLHSVERAVTGLHFTLSHPGDLAPAIVERIAAGARQAFVAAFVLNMRVFAALSLAGAILAACRGRPGDLLSNSTSPT